MATQRKPLWRLTDAISNDTVTAEQRRLTERLVFTVGALVDNGNYTSGDVVQDSAAWRATVADYLELLATVEAEPGNGTVTAAIDSGQWKPGEFDHPYPVHDAEVRSDVGGDGWYVYCTMCRRHCGHYDTFDAADAYARHHRDTITATRRAVTE